jgi:hypothetical protein
METKLVGVLNPTVAAYMPAQVQLAARHALTDGKAQQAIDQPTSELRKAVAEAAAQIKPSTADVK